MQRKTAAFILMAALSVFAFTACFTTPGTQQNQGTDQGTTQDVQAQDVPLPEPPKPVFVEPEVVKEPAVVEVVVPEPDIQPAKVVIYTDVVPPAGYTKVITRTPPPADIVVERPSVPPMYLPPQIDWTRLIPPNYANCPHISYKWRGKCVCPSGTAWNAHSYKCQILRNVAKRYCS
ncbi:hypothetical protein KJ865_07660, partial [Myxococcota bacterium]|nr:hypothetical protein [Myxococcota bacterium]